MKKISTIILTYNSSVYITKCLGTLLEVMPDVATDFEIVVIDNGSHDGSVELLKEFELRSKNITCHYLPNNTGTTYSRNIGLREVTGDYVLILDSDAYVNTEALEKLIVGLEENPSWGLICPKLTYPDGRFQISVDTFPTLARKARRFLFLKNMEQKAEPENIGHRQVDYAISAFWLLKKEVVKKVGLLDEKIFYSPEDVDYCIRVWKAGYKIVYDPSVSIVHDAQEISRKSPFNRFALSHMKGLLYLFIKHRYGLFGLGSLYRSIGKV